MFAEPTGGGAKAYKAKKRRFPKTNAVAQDFTKRAKRLPPGGKYRTPPTPLAPKVGSLKGGALAPLARNLRKAAKGTSPFAQPDMGPKDSTPYKRARARTRAKYRRA